MYLLVHSFVVNIMMSPVTTKMSDIMCGNSATVIKIKNNTVYNADFKIKHHQFTAGSELL